MDGVMVSVAARTQTTLAMSSGEAEFYPGVSGVAAALFLRGALEVVGWHPNLTVAMDSSAARGAASHVGAGHPRAMEKAVENRRVRLQWPPDRRNTADIGAKSLATGRFRLLAGLAGMAGLVTNQVEEYVCVIERGGLSRCGNTVPRSPKSETHASHHMRC